VQLDARKLRELQEIYAQAAADVGLQIAARRDDAGRVQLEALRDLLAQIEARLVQLTQQRNAALSGALREASFLGVSPLTGEVIDNAGAMVIADRAVLTAESFIAADGLQLSDRLWRLDNAAREVIAVEVEQAVIQGHSAVRAARDLLGRGERVPVEISRKADLASVEGIVRSARRELLNEPLANALRVMRTEINRAHGEAFMAGAAKTPGFVGFRFKLSPRHPGPDICDLLARQNLYGLGPGVYPTREKCPWPAHPNTLSFVEIVFDDEVTPADREGRQTPIEALAEFSDADRAAILGKGKAAIFEAGQLRQGMIRSRLQDVRRRLR
jgi:hypothetical protein